MAKKTRQIPVATHVQITTGTASSERSKASSDRSKTSSEGLKPSGEGLKSSGEGLKSSGEELRSSGEGLKSSGEGLKSSGKELRSSGEGLKPSGKELRSSGEGLKNSNERLKAWLEKYEPVEREIFEARARRLDNAAQRRAKRQKCLGDLMEATGGLAAVWRREDTPLKERLAWIGSDTYAFTCLMRYQRSAVTREIDRLRHRIKRPIYYKAENERRRGLAAERRKIRRRSTENPCPEREEILEAWKNRAVSHESALRFGSIIEDLECYLDNSLRFNDDGVLVGRNGGIKRWLQENIPALYLRYTTVMRYKAAARKARQITGLTDPTPADRLVSTEHSSAVSQNTVSATALGTVALPPGSSTSSRGDPSLEIVRARAVWAEVVAGISAHPTNLFARLDALLDPECVEDANMLASWRRKYENEITLRTKSKWWKRLCSRRHDGDVNANAKVARG